MPRIALTGYKGYVGQELMKFPDMIPLPCDVRNYDDVENVIQKIRPDIIVHLASISDVDKCEDKKNFHLVKDTNVIGTMNVAEIAGQNDCGVVLLSSVHVFDGRWGNYKEKDVCRPANFYGLTKFSAEGFTNIYHNLKVIRTAHLFDYRRMFPDIYALRNGEQSSYPTFIERSFMYLPHFVESLYAYLLDWDRMPRMLHVSGSTTASWYAFMKSLANVYGIDERLVCPRSQGVDGLAPRPKRGGLNVNLSKKLGLPQHDYYEGLLAMRELA